jgi:formyl-CoA transferase
MTQPQAGGTDGLLSGVRVTDFSAAISGPYATRILAELGADVIKIEPPDGGDQSRTWLPAWGDKGCYFLDVNPNKRSLCVDLKSPLGGDVVRRLLADTDVVVENFRPGVMDRLGFGYSDVRGIRDDVIYCSISAYGQTGEHAGWPGYDPTLQAMTGLMRSSGNPEFPPERIGPSVVDRGASVWSVIAILAALYNRRDSGQGQHIDTSLLDAAMSLMSFDAMSFLATEVVPTRQRSVGVGSTPSQIFDAQDGPMHVAAPTQRLWRRCCEAIGRPDLLSDSRFATNRDRMANRVELVDILETIFRTKPRSYWVEHLNTNGVPCGAVHTVAEAVSAPAVVARGCIREESSQLDGGAPRSFVASPLRFSQAVLPNHQEAPALGADTDAILRDELGYEAGEIVEMREKGVVA